MISIEALPKHAETVRSSVEVNRMRGVEVHATAVGEASGTAVLTRPADSNAGMFTLGSVDGSETHTVPVRRIDDIVAGRRIDFIKMDIEGSEYKALLGAAETLKQKPPILIELNGPALRALRQLAAPDQAVAGGSWLPGPDHRGARRDNDRAGSRVRRMPVPGRLTHRHVQPSHAFADAALRQ